MQAALEVIGARDQAATLFEPTRLRLLEQFRTPCSAAEAARALDLPRQRVGHHVRLLKSRALLREVGERRKGNFVEQLLQATARAYVIAPQALGEMGSVGEIRDRFSSAYLMAVSARTIGEVSRLQQLARDQGRKLPTLTLETEIRFGSPASQAAFAEELTACVAGLVRKYHDATAAEGREFRFTMAGHPALPSEQQAGENDSRGERHDP